MTRTKQDDSSHLFPKDDDLPSWAESAPDWRRYTRDEMQHERMIEHDYQ